MNLISRPVHRSLSGSLRLPGDKSISHRAAILGAMASGTTTIDGFLCADDTLATLSAMASLGAEVERDGERVSIIGRRLHAPRMDLDLGNSGTGLRLITGALCGHPDLYGQRLRLVGDASLSARPMGRIILPLSRMGARIDSHGDCAPLMLEPVPLTGAVHTLEIASAQVKSALLLAGIQADGTTTVLEPGTSRDHTERMLPAFGVAVQRQPDTATLEGPASLSSCHITVPGDLSSAAFPLAAALLVPGSSIELCSIGLNPSRDGLLNILKSMLPSDGFRIRPSEVAASHEPMGDLLVTRSQPLEGTDIPAEMVSLAIDEFPILMTMAAVARGTTTISGAEELRVKESDRLAVMCEQLQRLGVELTERPDGALIRGGAVQGGRVDAMGDHRIAMSLAVLGLVAKTPIEILNAEWIRTSYPSFVDQLNALGADLCWSDA